MRLQRALGGASSGPARVQMSSATSAPNVTITAYTVGTRWRALQSMTFTKMGIMNRPTYDTVSLNLRLGIWENASGSLLGSTPVSTIVASSANPTMINLNVPVNILASSYYFFGVWVGNSGTRDAIAGGDGTPIPAGLFDQVSGVVYNNGGFSNPNTNAGTGYVTAAYLLE